MFSSIQVTSVRFFLIFIILLTYINLSAVAQKEIELDSAFLSHSEKYTPKIPNNLFAFPKISFGPIKIQKIEKLEKTLLDDESSSGILKKSDVSKRLKLFHFQSIYDSIPVNVEAKILKETITTSQTAFSKSLFGSGSSTTTSRNICLSMKISFADKIYTYISAGEDTLEKENDYYYGRIFSVTDTLMIFLTKGFRNGNKSTNNWWSGIKIFDNSSRQLLAAYQFHFKKFVWLTKLQSDKKIAVSSFIVTLMSIIEEN